jgi:GMP synthase (glutamine-hydrolysing)
MIPESTSRRALVIQHTPEVGPGTLEMPLRNRGYAVDLWFISREGRPPSPLETYDAVLSLGGPGDPTTDEDLPWGPTERRAIEKLLECGTPYVGICLGAQLLAQVTGGRATREPPAAYGWQTVRMTDAGIADELMGTVPACLDAYHWHTVSFEAPESATLLAESDTGQEAFRVDSAWGIQYHPCIDLPQVAIWIELERSTVEDVGIDPDVLRRDSTHRMREYASLGPRLMNRLADHAERARASGDRDGRLKDATPAGSTL